MCPIFPDVWEICSVTPIYKSGDSFNVINYRPVSILPYITKLFESIVYFCIKRTLNHVIIDQQHSFRSGKSTATSSVVLTSYILGSFDNKDQVDVIFTDCRKA